MSRAVTEEYYRKLFDYAPDGIVITDARSYYLDVNPALCTMLGYTCEELIGKHASDIVVPSEVENIEPALRAIHARGDYKRLWHLRRKDGSILPAEVMITALPDGNLLGLIRDVTDRVAADNRIRELSRTYAILAAINQLIVREREMQVIRERACRIAVEKVGFLLAWIGLANDKGRIELAAHAGADEATLKIVESVLAEPEIGCTYTARALATGKEAVCNDIEKDVTASTWRDAALQRGYRSMAAFPLVVDGRREGTFNLYSHRADFFDAEEVRVLHELAGDISFAMTLSERERQRQSLEQQLAQAQKLQAIGTLASGIAHDFGNVLGAVAGNAHLARSELPDTHPAVAYLGEVDRAAKRARHLVQRLLTFGRPHEHILQPILLTPVLEEAIRLLRSMLPSHVELKFHSAADLPPVRADESQIHQIVLNLVTNAWHALKDSRGRIEIELASCRVDSTLSEQYRDLSQGPYVRLSVTDNGIGMTDAILQRMYEPFYTTKPPGEGTGLGLPVVYGIVHGHGGGIVVDTAVNRGSTFHVYLPVCTEQPNKLKEVSRVDEVTAGRGERILYIDDDDSLVRLTEHCLRKMGYRVFGYTEPAEALRAFAAAPSEFDVVITDTNMPHMTGLEVAKRILQTRHDIPLALTSGYIRPEDVEAARSLGVSHVVLKPDTIAQFGDLVRRCLANR